MPARKDSASQREGRRRELLRALLEEEEAQDEPLTQADLAALLREVQGARRPKNPLGGMMTSEQLQGFVWGMGAAALLVMILPSAKQTLRPFALSTLKGAMGAVDRFKELFGEAGEGLQDLFAEAQFERMKDAAGPDK